MTAKERFFTGIASAVAAIIAYEITLHVLDRFFG